jgi:hypothetical protein
MSRMPPPPLPPRSLATPGLPEASPEEAWRESCATTLRIVSAVAWAACGGWCLLAWAGHVAAWERATDAIQQAAIAGNSIFKVALGFAGTYALVAVLRAVMGAQGAQEPPGPPVSGRTGPAG